MKDEDILWHMRHLGPYLVDSPETIEALLKSIKELLKHKQIKSGDRRCIDGVWWVCLDPSVSQWTNVQNIKTQVDKRDVIGQAINDFMAENMNPNDQGQVDIDWCDSRACDDLANHIVAATGEDSYLELTAYINRDPEDSENCFVSMKDLSDEGFIVTNLYRIEKEI